MSSRQPVTRLNDVISMVLICGVIISSVVVGVGLSLLIFAQPAGTPTSLLAMLDSGFGRPTLQPASLIEGSAAANPVSLLQLGTLILFATPLARVIFSVFLFLRERDYSYVGVTLLVLVMLLLAVFVIGPTQA